jgi:hypothetical protein
MMTDGCLSSFQVQQSNVRLWAIGLLVLLAGLTFSSFALAQSVLIEATPQSIQKEQEQRGVMRLHGQTVRIGVDGQVRVRRPAPLFSGSPAGEGANMAGSEAIPGDWPEESEIRTVFIGRDENWGEREGLIARQAEPEDKPGHQENPDSMMSFASDRTLEDRKHNQALRQSVSSISVSSSASSTKDDETGHQDKKDEPALAFVQSEPLKLPRQSFQAFVPPAPSGPDTTAALRNEPYPVGPGDLSGSEEHLALKPPSLQDFIVQSILNYASMILAYSGGGQVAQAPPVARQVQPLQAQTSLDLPLPAAPAGKVTAPSEPSFSFSDGFQLRRSLDDVPDRSR